MKRNLLAVLFLFGLLSCNGAENETHRPDIHPGMCAKEKMAADGIVRLSKIEVYPKYLDEYVLKHTRAGRHTASTSLPHISRNTNRGRCTWSSRWYCQTRHRLIPPTDSITL